MQENELLIYDSDCAFCQKCVDWGVKKLAYFPKAIGFQAIQPRDYALTEQDVQSSIWLIQESGAKLSANRAATAILKSQPKYRWRLLGSIADAYWVAPVARRIYFLLAKNRHKMPGATQACELPNDTK
ncbi:MAG: thiol-disulfide oxidoreductase DCC family protein [Micrococcales bacterium]